MADLLRFATAGSVDDGKSTLIGRLLYDSKSVFADQLEAVERTSADRGNAHTDLALLTDGLRAEREQGITIDVAYRYFSTARRSFIVADTPGHVQYTRNMVTGASTADLALVLVDARKGVVEQTRRHASLSALLRVPHLVLVVNKMDLVGFDQARYDEVVADFKAFCDGAHLNIPDVQAVPVAALHGDNVVDLSDNTPWYDGPALLELLETVHVERTGASLRGARFPVQYVLRPQSLTHPDYRGYAGTLATGTLQVGDAVTVLPSGRSTTVAGIDTFDGPLQTAVAGQAITVLLAEEIDISRGDMLVAAGDLPELTSTFDATVCWMSETPLVPGQRVLVKHTTRTVKAVVAQLHDRLDVSTQQHEPATSLGLNDIGRVTLRTAQPLALDHYATDRRTGAFITIDEATGTTTGAGMVGSPLEVVG